MRRMNGLIAIAAVMVAMPVWAQGDTKPAAPTTGAASTKIDPAKEKSIRELLDLMQVEKFARQGSLQMLAMQRRDNPQAASIPADRWKMAEATFSDMSGLVEQVVRIYDKHYTQADINELLAFYKTPLGKKMLAEQSAIQQESTLAGQEWGRKLGAQLGAKWDAMDKAASTKGVDGAGDKPGAIASKAFDKAPFKSGGKIVKTASGLQIDDMTVGTGAVAVAGKTCVMHYTGTLADGTKFDSSRDRNQPFSFRLGAGQVIKGWDEGVAGMKVGGRRKLIIPPSIGYGAEGTPGGPIPPNATLTFDVELMDVK